VTTASSTPSASASGTGWPTTAAEPADPLFGDAFSYVVEVKVDEGQWQKATLSPDTSATYGWKLFTFDWTGATPGDHTLVSRVTDTNGGVQPTAADLATKKTFLEDNGQFPRKLTIA